MPLTDGVTTKQDGSIVTGSYIFTRFDSHVCSKIKSLEIWTSDIGCKSACFVQSIII